MAISPDATDDPHPTATSADGRNNAPWAARFFFPVVNHFVQATNGYAPKESAKFSLDF
jgi:hypothetical protein